MKRARSRPKGWATAFAGSRFPLRALEGVADVGLPGFDPSPEQSRPTVLAFVGPFMPCAESSVAVQCSRVTVVVVVVVVAVVVVVVVVAGVVVVVVVVAGVVVVVVVSRTGSGALWLHVFMWNPPAQNSKPQMGVSENEVPILGSL